MAKKFTFDDAITTDIKGAASNSYIDNIKMIKILYHYYTTPSRKGQLIHLTFFVKHGILIKISICFREDTL